MHKYGNNKLLLAFLSSGHPMDLHRQDKRGVNPISSTWARIWMVYEEAVSKSSALVKLITPEEAPTEKGPPACNRDNSIVNTVFYRVSALSQGISGSRWCLHWTHRLHPWQRLCRWQNLPVSSASKKHISAMVSFQGFGEIARTPFWCLNSARREALMMNLLVIRHVTCWHMSHVTWHMSHEASSGPYLGNFAYWGKGGE